MRNHRVFLIFVIFLFIYCLAVTVQIIAFYVQYARHSDHEGAYDPNGFLINNCLLHEGHGHWADWCTDSMREQNGFFNAIGHHESNILVLFLMTLIFLLSSVFSYGLFMLMVVQLRNFCVGMTTMERLGSAQVRNRRFSFAESLRLLAEEEAEESDADGQDSSRHYDDEEVTPGFIRGQGSDRDEEE